jgi:Ni,Fe-hydrogenase maturation factor
MVSIKKKKKILVFGNLLLEFDSLPLRLLPRLRKAFPEVEFKELDSVEDLEKEGRNLLILDSADGIKKAVVAKSIEGLEAGKLFTLHDFGLAHYLKLLKKAGLVDSVKVFCIPKNACEEKTFRELCALLKASLS